MFLIINAEKAKQTNKTKQLCQCTCVYITSTLAVVHSNLHCTLAVVHSNQLNFCKEEHLLI